MCRAILNKRTLSQAILYLSLAILNISSAVFGEEYSSVAMQIVQNAKRDCTSFENGKFNSSQQAITLYDITGDGRPEEIVDASQFSCSTAASLWGGSGGTYLWVVVDSKAYEFLAHKWRIIDVDKQKVLLLAVHSSQCSDIIGHCYRALVWSDGVKTTR